MHDRSIPAWRSASWISLAAVRIRSSVIGGATSRSATWLATRQVHSPSRTLTSPVGPPWRSTLADQCGSSGWPIPAKRRHPRGASSAYRPPFAVAFQRSGGAAAQPRESQSATRPGAAAPGPPAGAGRSAHRRRACPPPPPRDRPPAAPPPSRLGASASSQGAISGPRPAGSPRTTASRGTVMLGVSEKRGGRRRIRRAKAGGDDGGARNAPPTLLPRPSQGRTARISGGAAAEPGAPNDGTVRRRWARMMAPPRFRSARHIRLAQAPARRSPHAGRPAGAR